MTKQVANGVKLSLTILHYHLSDETIGKILGMGTLHSLPAPEYGNKTNANAPLEGEVVALPFIKLETVLKTIKMLRHFPDQSILDHFNRERHLS